jgi:hypothetical protein
MVVAGYALMNGLRHKQGEKEMVSKKPLRHGMALAAKEHLAAGNPITRMEAMVLYGVANLPDLIKEMRTQGFVIKSHLVTYAAAAARINRHAVLQPPTNLPVREIVMTEYWVSK